MSKNPNRSTQDQSYHDQMLQVLADSLSRNGWTVLADHIGWRNGSPSEVNGHVPDIVATKNTTRIYLEVEDCTSYKSDHTRSQLASFSRSGTTYVMIPKKCYRDGQPVNPVPEMLAKLKEWGLTSVKYGTIDLDTDTVSYQKG